MSMTVSLSPDELLMTTRSVRRRLDLHKAVPRETVEECIAIAQQAPSESDSQRFHFVVVTDPGRRKALAGLFSRGLEIYKKLPGMGVYNASAEGADRALSTQRLRSSLEYLVDHLHEVPVHVVPCVTMRTEGHPVAFQSAIWGSVAPATWSFMLAARSRGLGTCWTSLHLYYEEEAADILGIPHDRVMQTALVPVAHTTGGTRFRPARRQPPAMITHWESW